MWSKYRPRQEDKLEAARLRKLMPTFEHIPELIAPVTCSCRKIVPTLRKNSYWVIRKEMVLTGDYFPVIAEVDKEFAFQKAILWLAGGAVREFLRDASMQGDDEVQPGEKLLPIYCLWGSTYVLRAPPMPAEAVTP